MATVTVVGTVRDPSGTFWKLGTITARFVPARNFTGMYTYEGAQYRFLPDVSAQILEGGDFNIAVPSNADILPAGSRWEFILLPRASNQGALTIPISVVGTEMDITSQVEAVLPIIKINPQFVPYAYNDDQVLPTPGFGQLYFDTTNTVLKYWDGTSWNAVVSGSTPSVGLVPLSFEIQSTTGGSASIESNVVLLTGIGGAPIDSITFIGTTPADYAVVIYLIIEGSNIPISGAGNIKTVTTLETGNTYVAVWNPSEQNWTIAV